MTQALIIGGSEHESEHGADDDNQTDNIDDRVHDISPGLHVLGERQPAPAVPLEGRMARGVTVRDGKILVEPSGIEPLTSSLRTRRSTN